ncbi:MAG: hypothetical protein J7K12_02640, partial [Thermoplasmata archaeon]|nr:hypothetical protein [Thermoplasmata archaeon]
DKLGNRENWGKAKARCHVSYPWDVNQDGVVDIMDIYQVVLHWMETPESETWYERADVNGDDIVNIMDLIAIAQHWSG